MSGFNFSYVDIWIFGLVDNDKVCGNISRSTWELVAENVWPDVLSACKIVKNEMEENPTLVARFGHVLFRRYVIWFPSLLQQHVLS